jgi:hypothetical protein
MAVTAQPRSVRPFASCTESFHLLKECIDRIFWFFAVYGGKQRHVGRYKDETAAARAYDNAALFLYGGKAILNFTMEDCLADTSEVCYFPLQAKESFESAASAHQIGVQQAPQGRRGLLPASQLNINNQHFRSTEWCRCSTLHQQVSGQYVSHTPAGWATLVGDAQQLRYPTSSHSSQLTPILAACSSAQCPPAGQYLLAQVGPQAAPVPSAACQEQQAIAGAAPLQAPAAALAASSVSGVSYYCHTSQAAAGSCCSSWSMLSPGSAWTVNSHGRECNSSSSCPLPYSPSISANPHHHTASTSPAQHLPGHYQPLLPSQDAMQPVLPPLLAAPPPILLGEAVACHSASSYSMLSRDGSILDPRAPLLFVQQPAGGQHVLPGPAWQKQTVPGMSSACTVSASSCSISVNTAELQHITGQSAGLCELDVGAMGLEQQLPLGDGSLLWTGPPSPGSLSLCGGPLEVPQWQQQAPKVVVSSTPGSLADAQSALHIAPHVNHLQA